MTLDKLRESLQIDQDDLDRALVEQPDLYYHAGEGHIQAISVRDGIKLELDETRAELDKQVREAATRDGEKVTEGAITARISTLPKMKELERKFLQSKLDADRWKVLETAFGARSKALDGLVTLFVRRHAMVAAEHGAVGMRRQMAESVEAEAGRIRRYRRGLD
jgi:hypothetical protein